MVKQPTAMHVAKITSRPKNGKAYQSYLVRHSYREGQKVKHRTLANITHLPRHVIDLVRRALKGETFLAPDDAFEILRATPHGHVAAVLGMVYQLGVDRLLGARSTPARQLALAMIAQRILAPGSKLSLARALDPETATSSLGEELGVAGASEDELYAAMDWLLKRQAPVEAQAGQAPPRGRIVGALRRHAPPTSRAARARWHASATAATASGARCRSSSGLLTTDEGRPVAVEVFEGNTADPKTVLAQVEKLRERFGLVACRAGGRPRHARPRRASARICARHEGLSWITALRAPAIRKLVEQEFVERSLFDARTWPRSSLPSIPGERLIVCKNPLLAEERRAQARGSVGSDRGRISTRWSRATRRKRQPLAGQGQDRASRRAR